MSDDSISAPADDGAPRFTNAVRRGTIGVVGSVAAAGQEVSVRIHDFGAGVSQLIGTGNGDTSEADRATRAIDGLRALEADGATDVIVLAIRPVESGVEQSLSDAVRDCTKPVVVCFVGGWRAPVVGAGASATRTTKEAALQAVLWSGVKEEEIDLHALNWPLITEVRQKLAPEQRYVRGLFCGSDLCAEAMFLAMEKYEDVHGNAHPVAEKRVGIDAPGVGHTFLDYATLDGRPDPIVDPAVRIDRLLREADDPEVGVIALDFILGRHAHQDPVGVMLPAIAEAKQRAAGRGRHLEILGYVLGTDLDTPSLTDQVAALEAAGVTIASSNANTGLLSREFVAKG